jgi:heme A synthase
MSLRAFHIIFVIVTVALSLFVALWGFRQYANDRDTAALALALVFLGTAAGLSFYGRKVYAKLKELP